MNTNKKDKMKPENESNGGELPELATAICWADITVTQPADFARVLFACKGGMIKTGMYYPETMMQIKGRKYFGKYGRRCEPARDGYIVTHWMPLPNPPNDLI
jgi:hypothetical protein